MQLLEHLHVNVNSLAATEAFLRAAVPQLQRRGGGDAPDYGPWVHYGSEQSYIAFTEVPGSVAPKALRHIGLMVDDVEALMARLEQAGYRPADSSALDGHPHRRRVYYVDDNGLDWEFVEYLSEDPAQRNDYSQ